MTLPSAKQKIIPLYGRQVGDPSLRKWELLEDYICRQ